MRFGRETGVVETEKRFERCFSALVELTRSRNSARRSSRSIVYCRRHIYANAICIGDIFTEYTSMNGGKLVRLGDVFYLLFGNSI